MRESLIRTIREVLP